MDKRMLDEYADALVVISNAEKDNVAAAEYEDAIELTKIVRSVIDKLSKRIQRIIRYKYEQGMTWEQVASKMGRGSTADSVRMELNRAIKDNDTS